MDQQRKVETIMINGEFRLPEVITQRIQSFLTAKQAAQTTILSKSWYDAWLSRPNLDLDSSCFSTSHEFTSFTTKTIKRYEESKLKIESFSLCLGIERHDHPGFVKDLTVKALKMGATNLTFQSKDSARYLPDEVLRAENLVRLSVEGCIIDLCRDRQVRCSRLESISLSRVEMEEDYVFPNIISSCPLIEKLLLSFVDFQVNFRGLHKLKCLVLNHVKIGTSFFEDLSTESGKQGIERMSLSFVDYPINLHRLRLHKLRCLVLNEVKIGTEFFEDFSSKFPSLIDLTLKCCRGVKEEIRISSRSLERLNFEEHHRMTFGVEPKKLRLIFYLPSIRKFTFEGLFPSLTFKSASREWESRVSIKDNFRFSTSWFTEFEILLTQLSLSKIHLSLHISADQSFHYEVGDIQCLLKPEVENLTIDVDYLPSLSCYALFDGLFRLCRPKSITQYWRPNSRYLSNNFLCKILVQALNGNFTIPSNFMHGLNDLEEVNVEIFEESVEEWLCFPLKSLLDGSTKSKDMEKIRFQLKWRP